MAGKASLKMWIGAASNFSLIPSCSICQSCWQLKLFGNSIRLYLNTERVILSIYYYSNEKVPFCVVPVRAEAFLVFNRRSQPTLSWHIPTCCQQSADSWPTNSQRSADCWQKIFAKGGKWQSANCRPTVDRQLTDSFLGELFFTFSHFLVFTSS